MSRIDNSALLKFAKSPDEYVLRVKKSRGTTVVTCEHAGKWSWIKGHTFWKQSYNVSKVVQELNKTTFNLDRASFLLINALQNRLQKNQDLTFKPKFCRTLSKELETYRKVDLKVLTAQRYAEEV